MTYTSAFKIIPLREKIRVNTKAVLRVDTEVRSDQVNTG